MNQIERRAAATALINWFHSQEIMPGDAACVMSTVMAEQLVLKANGNLAQLEYAANTVRDLLLIDIAEWLRK